jgi:hypothetical protein
MSAVFPIFSIEKQGLDRGLEFATIIIVKITAFSVYRDGSFYL